MEIRKRWRENFQGKGKREEKALNLVGGKKKRGELPIVERKNFALHKINGEGKMVVGKGNLLRKRTCRLIAHGRISVSPIFWGGEVFPTLRGGYTSGGGNRFRGEEKPIL